MSGVSAAEKYAEVGEDRPRCECHGELMLWAKNPRYTAGGRWKCRRKDTQSSSLWAAANPEKRRASARLRRADPDVRRKETIYKTFYWNKRKVERYVGSGLVNEGLTRRNNGEEVRPSTDRAA